MTGLGARGEEDVCALLLARGAVILARNYRCRRGEIDIVAALGGYLLFVEVKARSEGSLARPAESVTAAKKKKLTITAQYYLMGHTTELQPRFDVADVVYVRGVPQIDYIENAF